MKKALFIFGIIALVWSCSDTEEPPTTPDPVLVELCDTMPANYNDHISVILNNSCSPCHTSNSAAGVNVSGYANAKIAAGDGNFIKTIKHENGVSAMPQNASKLSDSEIQQIECWIVNDYPEKE